jgi:hypothetical protein
MRRPPLSAVECKQITRRATPAKQRVDMLHSFVKCPLLLQEVVAKNPGQVLACGQLARMSEDNFQRFMCLLGNRLAEGRWLLDGPFQTSKIV